MVELNSTNVSSLKNKNDSESEALLVPNTPVKYEEAITATGYGCFNHWLLFVCGWANAFDAIEILCISFVLPAAGCELNLTDSDKGVLSGVMFLGMLLGGCVWGGVGDQFGRRTTLTWAMVINSLAAMSSSFVSDKWIFTVARFISGFGVGGSIPLIWSYFAEFQSLERRGRSLCLLASFWMVGNVVVAVIALMTLTHPSMTWRQFNFICALPSLFVAYALHRLPESPKFLLLSSFKSIHSDGKSPSEQCVSILSYIYSVNTGRQRSSYPIKQVTNESNEFNQIHPSSTSKDADSSLKKFKNQFQAWWSSVRRLFRYPHLTPMINLIIINLCVQFGYYGLWLWFPELFAEIISHDSTNPSTRNLSICDIIKDNSEQQLQNNSNTSQILSINSCHSESWRDPQIYWNSIYIALAALPANIWTVLQMDQLGRKFFLVWSSLLSGLSVLCFYFAETSFTNLGLSIIFGFSSTMVFNSLDCFNAELFPTSLRSTAMSLNMIPARFGAVLGNVVFGYTLHVACSIPILLVVGAFFLASAVGSLLPKTDHKDIH